MLTDRHVIRRMLRACIGAGIGTLVLAAAALHAQVVPLASLNTAGDDYAPVYRTVHNGAASGYEVWFTRTAAGRGGDDRRLLVSGIDSTGWRAPVEPGMPINQERRSGGLTQYLDGAPAFACGASDRGIIVSNRPDAAGRRHGNDLYEITWTGGTWSVRRIDENGVNSDDWDDTPALSDDGTVLYFASNRRGVAAGETDLYMSRRGAGGWGAPELLAGISEMGTREETPCVGADGWLYYASDREGTFDIWRVRLNAAGMPVITSRERLAIDGVNSATADELHPTFSPGGGWLLFSSNRGASHRFDIYAVPNSSRRSPIELSVLKRTRRRVNDLLIDETQPLPNARIDVVDAGTGAVRRVSADAQGDAALVLDSLSKDDLLGGHGTRTYIVQAVDVGSGFVSAIDTLLVRPGDACRRAHTLFVWDRTVLDDPGCRQDFAVQSVEFFVKGYWCPTTRRYAAYTPCQSVFVDAGCTSVAGADDDRQQCRDNDLYSYRFVPATVTAARQPDLCISWHEIADSAGHWTDRVDTVIGTLADNMRVALQSYCVQRSLQERKPVTITVIGWTDPDPIDPLCRYTGDSVWFGRGIDIEGMEGKRWIHNGVIAPRTKFDLSPANGNQMLSELRAYFMAVLLDSVWREEIPTYREGREQGMLRIVAQGNAVSQRQLPKQQQRSIDVVVTSAIEPAELRAMRGARPGGIDDLRCQGCR